MPAVPVSSPNRHCQSVFAILVCLIASCGIAATAVAAKPGTTKIRRPAIAKRPRSAYLSRFAVVGPNGARRVSFKQLRVPGQPKRGDIKPEHVKQISPTVHALNGKRIRISGFMVPGFKSKGITAFLFTNVLNVMTFPGSTPATEMFPVKMRTGVTTDYLQIKRFDVVGIFKVAPWVEDGEVLRVYQIEDAMILPVKKPAAKPTLKRRTPSKSQSR